MNNIIIDKTKCMSRKNKNNGLHVQCPNSKKNGDYCLIHGKSKKIFRIDQPLQGIYDITNQTIINVKNESINIKNDITGTKKIDNVDDILNKLSNKFDQNIIKKSYEKANNIKPLLCKDIYTIPLKIRESLIKKYGIEYLKKLTGPVYENITKSDDNLDPITQDVFWENNKQKIGNIDTLFLFSYLDSQNFIRCFHILSLRDMFDEDIYTHPITGEKINNEIILLAKEKINFMEKNRLIERKNKNNDILNEQKIKFKILDVFQKMSYFNIYMEEDWFIDLDLNSCHKLYKEMSMIWNENKNLVSVNFDNNSILNVNKNIYHKFNKLEIQNILIDDFNKLITGGLVESDKRFASWLIVHAFTYVSDKVKKAFPDLMH
jgi:hypothetical protein